MSSKLNTLQKQSTEIILNKIRQEVKLWSYAAWTSPFVALALLIATNYFGWTDLENKLMVIIVATFVATSVFWWWWAIHSFRRISQKMEDTQENFLEIKDQLSNVSKEMKDVFDDR